MMQSSSNLLAQRFFPTDKDVLYVRNAAANQPASFALVIIAKGGKFLVPRTMLHSLGLSFVDLLSSRK